jgi:hypothetical protein
MIDSLEYLRYGFGLSFSNLGKAREISFAALSFFNSGCRHVQPSFGQNSQIQKR